MTTFQAILYGIVHGFTEFLPVGRNGHEWVVPYVLNWPGPSEALLGAFSLGSFLSALVYFRHDWASMISCFLQVCIFRKRPMTLDERMPFFLTITSIPLAGATYYLRSPILATEWSPLQVGASLAAFGIPLWLGEASSRKNKGMFDWNWLDALFVGLAQLFAIIPGCGSMTAILSGALFRNYHLESAAKYAFFALTPVLAANSLTHLQDLSFHAPIPSEGLSWLSFYTSLVVTFFTGLVAIGSLMRQVQRRSFKQYIFYRWFVAIAVITFYWVRSR